ncbi:phosphoenolpyruvate--protein phosphotransferase [Sphingomonas changnyeongensis]|uniref:phosphoenolpyruvate--protein phosphotransferase n=2 Tax=Sphingomonas changnyeongensis TaxID=2698679 RepID=A0A7Z2S6W4_9SPHN|nr:phosphoenolpyruvate--protein phosphotransferase [Sphingomonas changnyeongensis]
MPLHEVADPVFASGSMGPGIAIDPLDGLVTAPLAGTVVAVARTGHSVTIAAGDGTTILIHIGLDTVALGGAGFTPQVAEGAQVAPGDPLICFDLDHVARAARSVVTPIVVIGEGDRMLIDQNARLVTAGAAIGHVVPGAPPPASPAVPAAPARPAARRELVLAMANGIHARPSARIVAALRPYAADVAILTGARRASARSTVALLTLAARHGDRLTIEAHGPDAEAAADALFALIDSGMGEAADHPPPVRAHAPPPAMGASQRAGDLILGVTGAPGLAIGVAAKFRRAELAVPETGGPAPEERAALDRARAAVAARLDTHGHGPMADIAAAHRALVDDPELADAAGKSIDAGASAAFAWRRAVRDCQAALAATGDALLIERIDDLADIERQVIAELVCAGTAHAPLPSAAPPHSAVPLPRAAILIADDLLPSEFQALDTGRLAGIALARGGPTSHVAILAAAAGVPMLVALGPDVLAIADGQPLILDADAGLDTAPDELRLDAAAQRLAAARAARAEALAEAHRPAMTRDGTHIEVFANLGSAAEAGRAVAGGAEGCGLLRTEFLFLDRADAPGEAEQARIYGEIAAALADRPLIVRTFDIGGDKPAPYLPMATEDNPALGLRGVRLNLARQDLLDTQLRAILAGVPAPQRRIMVPMVIEPAELAAVRDRLRAAERTLGIDRPTPLGVMVETPAAALGADAIAREADFLSIGSNDLTQYALACDRGNPATAARVDALHPAVLRLIALAAEGAARHGRWIGVCGGIASDPLATPLLIGLGVTELSVAIDQIAPVKARLRMLDLPACRDLARTALCLPDARAVRALAQEFAR